MNILTIGEPPPSLTVSAASLPINAATIVLHGVFNPFVANNTVTFGNGAAGTVTSASTSALTVAFTATMLSVAVLSATAEEPTAQNREAGRDSDLQSVAPEKSMSRAAIAAAVVRLGDGCAEDAGDIDFRVAAAQEVLDDFLIRGPVRAGIDRSPQGHGVRRPPERRDRARHSG